MSPVTPPRPFIKGQYSGTSFVERKIEETTNPKGIKIVRLNRARIVPLMIIKGKEDEITKVKKVPEVISSKKGWFK